MLLIDEIDRADDEFEAFLLEFLSDFQVSIPELGTIAAERRPLVVITSNRTRELHDALKRRCLYHWIDYPDRRTARRRSCTRACPECRTRSPSACARRWPACAARSSTSCPAWARRSRGRRRCSRWTEGDLDDTLGVVLKVREDIDRVREREVLRGCVSASAGSALARGPPDRPARPARGLHARRPARASAWTSCSAPTARSRPSIPPIAPPPTSRCGPRCAHAVTTSPRSTPPSRSCSRAAGPGQEPVLADDGGRGARPAARRRARRGGGRAGRGRGGRRAVGMVGRRAPARQGLRRLHGRRAPGGPPRHAAARARAGPTRPSRRTRAARRRGAPPHAARPDLRRTMRASLRTGGDPFERHWREPLRAAATARARLRRVRLDGAVRAHAAPVHAGLRGRPQARRGVRVRHAPHARDRRARRPRPRPRARPRRRRGGRLVGRHAHRRGARHAQPRARPQGRPRRDRRAPLGRLGPRRSGASSPPRWRA